LSIPLLTDSFWNEDVPSTLHGPTVLKRIRRELSAGLDYEVTIAECFQIAQDEMGTHPSLCIFGEEEIGRPLFIIGAVWGFRKYGIETKRARSFGCFLGSYAGGDAVLAGAGDKLEKQAAGILYERLGRRYSLNPIETNLVLDDVIRMYQDKR
jgi:hypothetical protein